MSKPQMRQRSLLELGHILIALHQQGYTADPGCSFAERDGQFGEGSITVQAICIPPGTRTSGSTGDCSMTRTRRAWRFLVRWLPPCAFTTTVFAVTAWVSGDPVHYPSVLAMAVAMTGAGFWLDAVDESRKREPQG